MSSSKATRPNVAIRSVVGRQVLDSRGNPTVEVDLTTRSGLLGRASVPSGASTGVHEALELRDGDKELYGGKGVLKAVANVNKKIAPALTGLDTTRQRALDELMIGLDGTENKRKLGANAILGASMAAARAGAIAEGVPLFQYLEKKRRYRLPIPMMNVINGGMHAGNSLSVQEFLIEPAGARSCSEAVRLGAEVYHALRTVLEEKHGPSAINVGDEGGYAPPLKSTRQALDAIGQAIARAGYSESQIRLGLDAASSSFYDEKKSVYTIDGEKKTSEELLSYYLRLIDEYPIATLEDPFHEEAFEDFASLTKAVGKRVRTIGDDLYVTNTKRIRRGIETKATNAVLIKLNQIGTVTETMDAIRLSGDAGFDNIVSHRSGETEDTFISHLATAVESLFIKTGAPTRGERTAKYNELLRIEEQLGTRASFAGRSLR